MQWIYGFYTSEKINEFLTFNAWETIFAEKFINTAGIKKETMGCCFPVQVSNFKFLTLKQMLLLFISHKGFYVVLDVQYLILWGLL